MKNDAPKGLNSSKFEGFKNVYSGMPTLTA